MVVLSDAWMLWVLVPLYALWALAWMAVQVGGLRWFAGSSVRFSATRRVRKLKPSKTLLLRRAAQALRLGTVGLLVMGMARPQSGRSHTQVHTEGIDILLAVDTSGSMAALDLDAGRAIAKRRNRLEVVTDVMRTFVEKRGSDQIGLVVFGSEAFTQCPLTLDHGIVATFLDRLEIGMAGDATAVGSALGVAVKRLERSTAKSRVVILLTDGRSNAGVMGPSRAADIAKTLGVRVYTIGAGTRGQAPVLVDSLFGPQVQYIDAQIDEETLQEIAETTGGAYFRAEDADALQAIYDQIDELEKTEIEMTSYTEYDERFAWFVVPAVLLLLLEIVLLQTRLRKIP